jgi:hypothetical protein
MKTRFMVVAFVLSVLVLPASANGHKYPYPVACSELWGAVKDTLSNPHNYKLVGSDDSQMTASYNVKHSAHLSISGALAQGTNHVALVSATDGGCEMQVDSSYSGWEHDDQGDFKKRVDESLNKLKAAKPSDSAKPADSPK